MITDETVAARARPWLPHASAETTCTMGVHRSAAVLANWHQKGAGHSSSCTVVCGMCILKTEVGPRRAAP